jgi:hypothetical protein
VYQHNIDALESHIHTLEDKVLSLHTELNGDDNIEDLDIPEYNLQLETMTIGSTIGDLNSDDASSHAVSIADDEDFQTGEVSTSEGYLKDHDHAESSPKFAGPAVKFSPTASPTERKAQESKKESSKSRSARRGSNGQLLRDNAALRLKVSNLTEVCIFTHPYNFRILFPNKSACNLGQLGKYEPQLND